MAYLTLETRLLLLNVADLGNESLYLFFLLLDTDGVLAADLFNFLGTRGSLGLELGLPVQQLAIRPNQLAFQVQTGLRLLLQLYADGLQVDLNLLGVILNLIY